MKDKLIEIKEAALSELKNINVSQEMETLRVKYLGKKGELTGILRGMGGLSAEERPLIGKLANEVRAEIEAKIDEILTVIKEKEKNAKLESEVIDNNAWKESSNRKETSSRFNFRIYEGNFYIYGIHYRRWSRS